MLDGQTFYSYEYDDFYQEAIYAKMTFSGGIVTRTEVINGEGPFEFSVTYTLTNGRIKADIPAIDGDPVEYGWFTLLYATTDAWMVKDEGDNNQDGTIDFSTQTTLYLSKPTGYPANL